MRFVFKEFPIFGQRWPESVSAAKTGLQVWQQKGADAYLKYHNAIYATGHNEGKLTDADISAAAKAVKFDTGNAADVQGTLDGIYTLARQLGFGGTPALVVLPSVGASVDNISVIPGFTQAADLQKAIDKAASTTKNNLHVAGIYYAGTLSLVPSVFHAPGGQKLPAGLRQTPAAFI